VILGIYAIAMTDGKIMAVNLNPLSTVIKILNYLHVLSKQLAVPRLDSTTTFANALAVLLLRYLPNEGIRMKALIHGN
jgi:hypothetical protein